MPLTKRPRRALKSPYPPMEARSVEEFPRGPQWQYEPKWDGFRCLVFRENSKVTLQSKSGRPLGRYFPDVVAAVLAIDAPKFVLDAEIVIPVSGRLSFDELLLRIHPAQSRVLVLSKAHPAMLVVFDLLADSRAGPLTVQPLKLRRTELERFARDYLKDQSSIRLSPATPDPREADRWFKATGGNLDGVIAKRLDLPYRSGERDGMVKVKHRRTADCVVGGFRYAKGKRVIGSLLLGLYNEEGELDHVGFTSSFTAEERQRVTRIVKPLVGPSAFGARSPGRPTRWSTRESDRWQPLKPRLVVEVEYDHFTGGRFRHGTRLLRWRPDKVPASCTMEQVDQRGGSVLKLLTGSGRGTK